VLFTGRWPEGLRSFVVGVIRWGTRVSAYFLLLTDKHPPFSLEIGGIPRLRGSGCEARRGTGAAGGLASSVVDGGGGSVGGSALGHPERGDVVLDEYFVVSASKQGGRQIPEVDYFCFGDEPVGDEPRSAAAVFLDRTKA
jgi:Domain of unknown function (DUF4389)